MVMAVVRDDIMLTNTMMNVNVCHTRWCQWIQPSWLCTLNQPPLLPHPTPRQQTYPEANLGRSRNAGQSDSIYSNVDVIT